LCNIALWSCLIADALHFLNLTPSSDLTQIGWPTSLPTSEKGSFMKSVLREKVSISSMTWPYFMIYQALTEVCLSCYLAGSQVVFFLSFS